MMLKLPEFIIEPPDNFTNHKYHQMVNVENGLASVWGWLRAEKLWQIGEKLFTPRAVGKANWRWAGLATMPYSIAVDCSNKELVIFDTLVYIEQK